MSYPGERMYLDDTCFALNTVDNGYELEKVFGIRAHMLSQCFDDEVWSFILEERRRGKSVPAILCENGIDTYMISDVGNLCQGYNPFNGKIVCVPGDEYVPEVFEAEGDVYYHGYWISKGWYAAYSSVGLGLSGKSVQAYDKRFCGCLWRGRMGAVCLFRRHSMVSGKSGGNGLW